MWIINMFDTRENQKSWFAEGALTLRRISFPLIRVSVVNEAEGLSEL